MWNEFKAVELGRTSTRGAKANRPSSGNSSRPQLHILDSAFADLETITLSPGKPRGFKAEYVSKLPHDGTVQDIATQLRALNEQCSHLAQLLNNLQSCDSIAGVS